MQSIKQTTTKKLKTKQTNKKTTCKKVQLSPKQYNIHIFDKTI